MDSRLPKRWGWRDNLRWGLIGSAVVDAIGLAASLGLGYRGVQEAGLFMVVAGLCACVAGIVLAGAAEGNTYGRRLGSGVHMVPPVEVMNAKSLGFGNLAFVVVVAGFFALIDGIALAIVGNVAL